MNHDSLVLTRRLLSPVQRRHVLLAGVFFAKRRLILITRNLKVRFVLDALQTAARANLLVAIWDLSASLAGALTVVSNTTACHASYQKYARS